MRRRAITFALFLGALTQASGAQDTFPAAALKSIRRMAPGVTSAQVRFLAAPTLASPLRSVVVGHSRFDRALGLWQLHLQCEPRTACMTTLAIVESHDENLFPGRVSSRKPMLVHAGDRRQLTHQNQSMKLTIPVTCLEAGTAGDQVRVREANDGRILLALVRPDGSITLRSPR